MLVDLVIPEVGESIHEVQLVGWKKHAGDWVEKDEEVAQIETEKATVPVSAPAAGRLHEVLKSDGEFAEVGDTVARIETVDEATGNTSPPAPKSPETPDAKPPAAGPAKPQVAATPAKQQPHTAPQAPQSSRQARSEAATAKGEKAPSPPPTSAKTKPKPAPQPAPEQQEKQSTAPAAKAPAPAKPAPPAAATDGGDQRPERRVPMNMLRQTIARRLVEAQKSAALVTTFNEIDMQEVIDLRREFGESFRDTFETKLGFMSFFVKAAVEGLRRCPEINAQVDGTDIVYRDYYDIGVAIGSGRGLVVPVLRNCQRLSFAEIERQIADFAARAADSRLAPHELTGGTFTISNGGIYGSLLSTPIVNPPQSGVLGLHAIQDRPVARNGQVVIRPMMYVALTYDHRLVDGREAVGFLRRIKEVIETPSRLLLEV